MRQLSMIAAAVILAATVASRASAQEKAPVPYEAAPEHGIDPVFGVHFGLPDAVSATLGIAVGLRHLAPGFLFVSLEPGHGARRRSVGWIYRESKEPTGELMESELIWSLRISEMTTYENVAFLRPGRRYFGPEVHLALFGVGARLGVYAGAGPHATRVAFGAGVGTGM